MKRIAIINRKGGCGKTTAAVNLAACLSEKGKKTLLVDLDPQSSASFWFNLKDKGRLFSEALLYKRPLMEAVQNTRYPLLQVIASSGHLLQAEKALKSNAELSRIFGGVSRAPWDYVIIDCPSHLSMLAHNALYFASEAIVPVEACALSAHGLSGFLKFLDEVKAQTGSLKSSILPSRVDLSHRHMQHFLQQLQKRFSNRVLQTVIRDCVSLKEASLCNEPVIHFDSGSSGAGDFRQLTKEIIESHEGQTGIMLPPIISFPPTLEDKLELRKEVKRLAADKIAVEKELINLNLRCKDQKETMEADHLAISEKQKQKELIEKALIDLQQEERKMKEIKAQLLLEVEQLKETKTELVWSLQVRREDLRREEQKAAGLKEEERLLTQMLDKQNAALQSNRKVKHFDELAVAELKKQIIALEEDKIAAEKKLVFFGKSIRMEEEKLREAQVALRQFEEMKSELQISLADKRREVWQEAEKLQEVRVELEKMQKIKEQYRLELASLQDEKRKTSADIEQGMFKVETLQETAIELREQIFQKQKEERLTSARIKAICSEGSVRTAAELKRREEMKHSIKSQIEQSVQKKMELRSELESLQLEKEQKTQEIMAFERQRSEIAKLGEKDIARREAVKVEIQMLEKTHATLRSCINDASAMLPQSSDRSRDKSLFSYFSRKKTPAPVISENEVRPGWFKKILKARVEKALKEERRQEVKEAAPKTKVVKSPKKKK